MTWEAEVSSGLENAGIGTVAFLPDSGLAPLLNRLEADEDMDNVKVTREEAAIGVLSGAWLGGERGVLCCQSSGLANTLNAIASLNKPARIPFLGLITRRGDLGEFNLAQVPFGYAGPQVLDALGIRNRSLAAGDDVMQIVELAAESAFATEEPYILWLESSLTGVKDEF